MFARAIPILLPGLLAWSVLGGCGGETPTRTSARTARSTEQSVASRHRPAFASRHVMHTEGLMGSLSPQEANAALEEHLEAFATCFAPHAQRLRTLGGRFVLRFHIAVDGTVDKVHPIDSTVGNRDVERCAAEVAAAVQFPRPHGGEAELTWPLLLDPPDDVLHPVTWDPSRVDSVLARRGAPTLEGCRGPDSRDGYQVTTYVSRGGRVLSAGAIARKQGEADEELDCIVRKVRRWRMPPAREHQAKVTFELR